MKAGWMRCQVFLHVLSPYLGSGTNHLRMHRFERIVFHIGFHKTGTTAIQEVLTANLALLNESDWC